MSVRVVDLNNEAVEEERPVVEASEEERPVVEASEEVPQEEAKEIANEVVEEKNEEEEVKEDKPKPKRQTQKDRINCPKCFKEMSVKSYKYSHEKNCGGKLSDKPVKPHAKPKAKQQPKPKPPPRVYYSSSDDDDDYEEVVVRRKATKKPAQQIQPLNPADILTQHYQQLQSQMIQQKQDRYNSLCMNMFSTKTKKR